MADSTILNLVLWLPVLGMVALLLSPRGNDSAVRGMTLGVMLLQLALTAWLYRRFDGSVPGLQFETRVPWIGDWGVYYHIGLDGLNVLLVALTAFLGPLVVAGAFSAIQKSVKLFYAMVFFIQFAMLGTFLAQDLFLFYVFWEAMLIPMFLIIGIWGGERRIYATLKFVLYLRRLVVGKLAHRRKQRTRADQAHVIQPGHREVVAARRKPESHLAAFRPGGGVARRWQDDEVHEPGGHDHADMAAFVQPESHRLDRQGRVVDRQPLHLEGRAAIGIGQVIDRVTIGRRGHVEHHELALVCRAVGAGPGVVEQQERRAGRRLRFVVAERRIVHPPADAALEPRIVRDARTVAHVAAFEWAAHAKACRISLRRSAESWKSSCAASTDTGTLPTSRVSRITLPMLLMYCTAHT